MTEFIKWTDAHAGFLGVLQFFLVLVLTWITGAWKFFRQRPKFVVTIIDGPSFFSLVPNGGVHWGNPTHRNVFCLYLAITNRGSAAGEIDKISISFKVPATLKDFFRCRWVSVQETVALAEFAVAIGEKTKIYPFLRQRSLLSDSANNGYLRVGETQKGIVYFEETEISFGNHRPLVKNGQTKLKLMLLDTFGRTFTLYLFVPELTIIEARRFGTHVGCTLKSLSI